MLLSAGAFIRFFKLQKKLFVFKPRRKACKLPSGTYCPVAGNSQQYRVFVAGPAYRAGGLGAKLLAALPEYEAGAQAIIIEAEMPEKAEDEAMAVRRLGFYARCGARDTGYYEHLFDAWFRILVLPCPGAPELSDKDALDALVSCYKRTISESQWRKYVQFYAPDGSLRL